MKAKDILSVKDIKEEDCGVCKLHERAYKVVKLCCPHCGKEIDTEFMMNHDIAVVGETNYYSEDQIIEKMQVFDCEHCVEKVGMKLIPVQYNGNHDIYYTGDKDYLLTEKVGLTSKMKDLIENFTERIQAGEHLTAWNLQYWLEGQMEKEIARILHEKGLKF